MATVDEALDPFKNLRSELTCCLCLDYFRHPVLITKCSHSFCKACISQYCKKTGAKASCPKCRGELRPNNFIDNRPLANIVETFQQIEKTTKTWGRKPETCQELLKPFLENDQEPSRSQDLKFSAGRLRHQHKDVVKISEVPKQIEVVLEAMDSWRKECNEMKNYVSQIKSSVTEDFSFIKKCIDKQKVLMLKVIDQKYEAAKQKIDAVSEQLNARMERLLELQSDSEGLLKNTSSEEEVCIGYPVAIDEDTFDVEIRSITSAVQDLKKLLEKSMLEKYPEQLQQEPFPGTSQINEIQMDMADGEIASSSNSCWSLSAIRPSPGTSKIKELKMGKAQVQMASSSSSSQCQDSLQENGICSSAVASTSASPMSKISSQFSQWASNVTFDFERIHCKLKLTNEKRTVMVSRFPVEYEPSSKRFRNSQLMGSPSFSEGCHYWEVSTKNCDGWAIGVADGNIGRCDQLGRTVLSWCIEWSNKRLSAWHGNKEVEISEEKPVQVGVFLDIPRNCLSFYSCTDKEICFHQFEINVVNPVYPAFWIYGTTEDGFLTINDIKR